VPFIFLRHDQFFALTATNPSIYHIRTLPSYICVRPHLKMSPSTSHIASQLRQLIYYHLDNNMVRNALFLAGRLHAYEPRTSEASYLLALCYLQNGQVKAAWETSRNFGTRGTHLGCSYVYAQACLDLGKYTDGINALERSKALWASRNHWSKHLHAGSA
jgi:anaphase-promoting complex subunit 3